MTVLSQSLDFNNSDNVMLWAACCLGFFRLLRAREFTVNGTFDPTLHLTFADVQVDYSTNPQSIYQMFRKGCFIFLGRGSFPLCPVVSLTNYLHLRGPGPSSLFIYQNGTPLSRSQLSFFVQTTLQSAGIPGKFSGHSFRIGAATTAARKGFPDHLIKTLGHWSSEAYLLYVRTPVETILSVAGRLV